MEWIIRNHKKNGDVSKDIYNINNSDCLDFQNKWLVPFWDHDQGYYFIPCCISEFTMNKRKLNAYDMIRSILILLKHSSDMH
jgi:hypothetical protein